MDIDLFYLFKDRPKSIVVTGTNESQPHVN